MVSRLDVHTYDLHIMTFMHERTTIANNITIDKSCQNASVCNTLA